MTSSRIVITGSRGALGAAMVDHFLERGSEVIGLDMSCTTPHLTEQRERLYEAKLDASRADDARRLVAAIERERGPIEALIHCAGGWRGGPFEQTSDEEIDFLIGANLRSSALMVREVLGPMRERGHGRILLISSISTIDPGATQGMYAATKAALNAIVRSVAAETAGSDVTINALLPSIIDTPANREGMPDADHDTWVSPAQLVLISEAFLHNPGFEAVSGALLPVPAGVG